MKEGFVLNDWCAKYASTSREASNSTVQVRGSSNFEIPALKVGCTKEFPDIGLWISARTGITSSSSNLRILKWSENIGQESRKPKDIIIGEGCDGSGGWLQSLNHLQALVGFLGTKDLNMIKFEFFADFLDLFYILLGRHYNDGCRRRCIDGPKATREVWICSKSRDDYGDVFGGVSR